MPNHFISRLQGFVDFSPEELVALEHAMALSVGYRPQQDIVREGDTTELVFVMLEGWAYRYKILPNGLRQITAFLMPGDACDLHTQTHQEIDHSTQALTAAQVAVIPRFVMDRLMTNHATITRAMYLARLVDQATLRGWITSKGRRRSSERVAHMLCELYLRGCQRGIVNDQPFQLPMSQVVLADALGVTPVHINRVVHSLRDAGALQLARGKITISDTARLARIAGFDENYLHRQVHRRAA